MQRPGYFSVFSNKWLINYPLYDLRAKIRYTMKKNSSASLLPAAVQPLHQLGQHIRAARQARGWTIAETAARAVMSPDFRESWNP